MDSGSSVRIYASRVSFAFSGCLASSGFFLSLINMEISYLAYTAFSILICFPILFTRVEYNINYVKRIGLLSSQKIFFENVSRYTYDTMFLIKDRKWARLDLKQYSRADVDKLQAHIRIRLDKEAE